MSYLSGFLADKFDVDKAAVFPRVRNRATQGTDAAVRASMKGYSSINVTNSRMNILRTDWQYMLLPVWFMTYQFKGKTYEFALNGQSGKQAGAPALRAEVVGFCAGLAVFGPRDRAHSGVSPAMKTKKICPPSAG